MKVIHIAEQYCQQCKKEVGIEYTHYPNGKKERRCLSHFCETEPLPTSVCRLTGKKIPAKERSVG